MNTFRMSMISLAIVFWISPVLADTIPFEASIQQVTVYPGMARITRHAKVKLTQGVHALELKNLKTDLDPNSLSVSGEGSASVTVLGADYQVKYLAEVSDERLKVLEKKLQDIDDDIEKMNNQAKVLQQKEKFLESFQMYSREQLPEDLATQMPSVTELEGTLDFVTTQFQGVQDDKQGVKISVRDLGKKREALQREWQALSRGRNKEERLIVVDVECAKAGDLELNVEYSVYGASWSSLYDARVSFDEKKVVLSSLALVQQTTGEDWKDVALTVSTVRPSVGGTMPDLQAWYLKPLENMRKNVVLQYEPYYASTKSEAVMMDKAAALGNSAEAFEGKREMSVRKEVKKAQADVEISGTALVYKVKKPVTIKSDGTLARVPLSTQELAVDFEYATTPKLSPFAYLRSKVTNAEKEHLVAGRVNIFLDGGYVGQSQLDKTVPPGKEFDLYLGADEGVVVKRELLEEKMDETLIGKIQSSVKKISYVYKVIVENYKTTAVNVNVFDNMPISQNDKITIKGFKADPKVTEENYQDREGVLLWTLQLKPKENKSITTSFTVEYPREMIVEGL